jgi:hypothetical protein
MRTAALLATACLIACAHSTLSGTNIPDTAENRAVLETFAHYRDALEARDPSALYALAAPSYADRGDASRSLSPTDYTSLKQKLQNDFTKVTGIKLEATIKDIAVKGDEANLDYFQVLHYAVKTPTGETWKSESDDARMKFVRISGQWKIVSGL